MFKSQHIVYTILLLSAFLLMYCGRFNSQQVDMSQFKNIRDSVDYVGMNTCRSCHDEIHKTFMHTGMGRSIDRASAEKSDATFTGHELVYDKNNDLYYRPFFKDSIMYITEFRIENGDTTHQRTEKISYIIGSGHHTNSHIVDVNGYIFQAPITYYTQKGEWDLAPSFDKENTRFDRTLTPECITCHNHFPKFVEGSLNRFSDMPTGIECERCHGPGEVHVKEKLAGNIIDTSKYIDYSIVNPRHLPRDLQMDLCQRCHLQGVAVLEEEKSFFDFRPGMKLNEVVNVFLPRMTNSDEKFIMASQADRLRLSPCYQLSEMSCLTCHNPHISVSQSTDQNYNNACMSCHANEQQVICSAAQNVRDEKDNNCVACHMPPSESIDIPHVNITDHYISKFTAQRGQKIDQDKQDEIVQFLKLEILTKDNPTHLDMAKGYIALYDKYITQPAMLDSAAFYLSRITQKSYPQFKTEIHYLFAKEDHKKIVNLASNHSADKIKDGWTAYRIGEAFFKTQEHAKALLYFKRATQLDTYNLEFQEKLGSQYMELRYLQEAKKTFEFILQENPKRKLALNNLGFTHVLLGKPIKGLALYDQAIALDPDYEIALMNKVAILIQDKSNLKTVQKMLKRILKINPENKQAQIILKKII